MTTQTTNTAVPLYAFMLAFIFLLAAATACTVDDSVPAAEIRAQEINKTIMCPVCPGESIDQSQHPLAAQMRGIVDEKLDEGWTDNRIRRFFAERYGPSVLLEPPREGLSWLVWVVPPAMVTGAAIALYFTLRTAVHAAIRRRETLADEIEITDSERDDYFRRIEASLVFDTNSDTMTATSVDPQDSGESR